jgi:hypothetical protein
MPLAKKVVPIRYTSREFQSIKDDLIDYARRYYPNTFQDFNDASFGSLMLDTVSYVGDILSFYLDYQANESFLDTAIEYSNVIKLGRQLGYKFKGAPTSFGTVAFYITVPANSIGSGPNSDYLPILRKGSTVSSVDGASYILNESVNFSASDNEVVVADVDPDTGDPTSFAIRAYGRVISGEILQSDISVGPYQQFLKLEIPIIDVSEVLSVFDSEGHQYFEVENLSQNVVFVEVDNKGVNADTAKTLLKPIIVPRRFTVINEVTTTLLQFGFGSEENLNSNLISDPSDIMLDMHGKNYFSDSSFDPSKLTKTDKFGITPSNTVLTVTLRSNLGSSTSAAADSVTKIRNARMVFPNEETGTSLVTSTKADVIGSLECTNHDPILGEPYFPSQEELKIRIFGNYSAQNRAVTHRDYESIIYAMPAHFGSIKRVRVVQDKNSFKRNLNMYVISSDSSGNLLAANSTIKSNLKRWLVNYKMINDTIDILDAYILNIGIDFTIIASRNANKFDVLAAAKEYLTSYILNRVYEIGEIFYISDVYGALRAVPGLLDVVDVTITQMDGSNYSSLPFDLESRIDPDGRFLDVPKNVIVEVKYPDIDIRGTVR